MCVYQSARSRETVFKAAHVPWFTRPSCLTARLSSVSLLAACAVGQLYFSLFFFHLHRRSTITRLRSAPEANNASARSHFHNSHAFRLSVPLARIIRPAATSGPRSCSRVAPRIWRIFEIRVTRWYRDINLGNLPEGNASLRETIQRRKATTNYGWSPPVANSIRFARVVLSAKTSRIYYTSRSLSSTVCKNTIDRISKRGERCYLFSQTMSSPIKSDNHPLTRD